MFIECIVCDFDGVLGICPRWPIIDSINLEAVAILKTFQKAGGKVILCTAREGIQLTYAVKALREVDFKPDAVNENLPERIAKYGWDCRKVTGDVFIDDLSIDYTGDWVKYKSILLSPENLKHLRMKPRFKLNRK